MPTNVVKTKRDEHLWKKARARAAAEGHAKDWPYIMGIYQKMKGGAGPGRRSWTHKRKRG